VAEGDADILARLNGDNDMIDSDDYDLSMSNSIVNAEVDIIINKWYKSMEIESYSAIYTPFSQDLK
jgi:hypothetical protein